MDEQRDRSGDSQPVWGGTIPGSDNQPAFSLSCATQANIPVLIAVPHAGRCYPPALLDAMRHPPGTTVKLEDRYVDLIGRGVAAHTGAALMLAHAPRMLIDLNRAPNDIDWDMIARRDRLGGARTEPGPRARSGLGLIPRRLPGLGDLWRQRIGEDDLDARIAAVHTPYHACLANSLAALRDRWGAALLIDLHSMPPLPPTAGGRGAEFVIGDRFGESCAGRVTARCFGWFAAQNRAVAHNRPYAGGYVLDRHGQPQQHIHALQLEIDRSSYLDFQLAEPSDALDSLVDLLAGMVRTLADEVAALGRAAIAASWPAAAE